MSLDRGLQAINLRLPREIPHTQYISHLGYIDHMTGPKSAHPGESLAKVLDFDFIWTTASPDTAKPGLWTDMGRAYWHERQQEQDSRHLAFASAEEALQVDVLETYGVWDLETLKERYRREATEALKDHYAVYPGGTYRTQISFAIAAFGWQTLLEMAGLDLKRFTKILDDWLQTLKVHYQAIAAAPYDCVLTHDDMVWTEGAFIHPDWYRGELFPRFKEVWDIAHAGGKRVMFCSDGNFQEFVPDLAAAGADGFIFEPLVDLEYMAKEFGQTHVLMGGVDCRVMTFGTESDTRRAVRRALDLGRDCPGYFFAVGNHIPDNIPLQNVIACMDEYLKRRAR